MKYIYNRLLDQMIKLYILTNAKVMVNTRLQRTLTEDTSTALVTKCPP